MKDDRLYLIHISECIQRIEKYIGEGRKKAFMDSGLVQDAVTASEENIRIEPILYQ